MNVKKTDDTCGIVLSDDNELSTAETNDRFYSFCIVTYAYDCDITSFLECGVVVNYAYILHDKDEADKHIHCLFTTKQPYSCKNLVKLFQETTNASQNSFCRPIERSSIQAYKYLTHSTERAMVQGKTLYDESLIITNNALRWCVTRNNDISVDDFCTDLYAPYIDIEFMSRKYGRDFMRNIKSYLFCRELALNQKENKKC